MTPDSVDIHAEVLARPYSPWRHAALLGVTVKIVEDLRQEGEPVVGLVDFDKRVVELDSSLNHIGQRCTLAHELVHLERGPECVEDPGEEDLVERIAAARLLDLQSVANAMTVDIEILTAWLRESADSLPRSA